MKKTLLSLAIIVVNFTIDAQVGIGTTSPEGALDVVSTTTGVVFPRVANAAAVTTPVNGMIIFDLSLNCFNFYEDGEWSGCKSATTPTFACIGSATTIVDVTNPTTGKTWMDRNLGATRAALSSTDSDAYGDLYQWGRFTDGHQCRTSGIDSGASSTTTVTGINADKLIVGHYNWYTGSNPDALWQGVAGTNNPCPSGYRVPTITELHEERDSWISNDGAGAFGSPLKLTLAGSRNSSNIFLGVGTYGYYWSSTVSGTSSYLLFFQSNYPSNTNGRSYVFSVRCIKD